MTTKEALWSIILIVIMVVAVHFGNIAMDKCYDREMEIYDIRDESVSYDGQIRQLDHSVESTEGKLAGLNRYIESYREKVRDEQEKLSHEAFLDYRRNYGVMRTYDEYRHLISLAIDREITALNKLIGQRDKLLEELDAHKQRQIAEIPELKRERDAFNTKYAKELDPNTEAGKNKYYTMQAICVSAMTLSFLFLMKICPPFRYVVYSITAVAAVNHVSKKFDG